jgi:hypothetical protein
MGSSPSPPAVPNPGILASEQGALNQQAAIAQQQLNDVNQITPYGTINYTQNGLVPNSGRAPGTNGMFDYGVAGIPQMTATTTLSPGMQRLFNTSLRNSQTAANTQGALGKNVQQMLSKNVDLGPSATSGYLDSLNRYTMDPQWAQAQTQLNQQLANQGLTPGSEGWKYAQTQFGLNKSNAYNNMYLQGQNTAVQDILAQYNTPLNTLNALKTGSQVQQPSIGQLAPTAQAQIQPANYAGYALDAANLANQQYQAQLQSSNSMMGGLFGLGGQALGALPGLLSSDERMKTDIQPIGKEDGVPVAAYRYKGDPKTYPKVVGPMAQDVEKDQPGSTVNVAGRMAIRPDASARFGMMRKAA